MARQSDSGSTPCRVHLTRGTLTQERRRRRASAHSVSRPPSVLFRVRLQWPARLWCCSGSVTRLWLSCRQEHGRRSPRADSSSPEVPEPWPRPSRHALVAGCRPRSGPGVGGPARRGPPHAVGGARQSWLLASLPRPGCRQAIVHPVPLAIKCHCPSSLARRAPDWVVVHFNGPLGKCWCHAK